jgi:prophage regulatory protein
MEQAQEGREGREGGGVAPRTTNEGRRSKPGRAADNSANHVAHFRQGSGLQGRQVEIVARLGADLQNLVELQRDTSLVMTRLWTLQREEVDQRPLHIQGTGPRILRIAEVVKRVGLSRSSIWKMAKEGVFPGPRRLGPRSVGWSEAEVDERVQTRR